MKILLALIAGIISLFLLRKEEDKWIWVGHGDDPFKEN
jgi:hypothetical protein